MPYISKSIYIKHVPIQKKRSSYTGKCSVHTFQKHWTIHFDITPKFTWSICSHTSGLYKHSKQHKHILHLSILKSTCARKISTVTMLSKLNNINSLITQFWCMHFTTPRRILNALWHLRMLYTCISLMWNSGTCHDRSLGWEDIFHERTSNVILFFYYLNQTSVTIIT